MNLLAAMRYLVALNEHRHFGRAAEASHITQPALSNALRALEEEFGAVIVRRGRSFAGLTTEGERVLATAQRMLREHEVLRQELASEEGQPRGPLRLGGVPTATPVLSRFAAMLQAKHPGIVPAVMSLSSSQLEARLEALDLDMGLGYVDRMPPERAGFIALPQYTERYFLLRRAAKRHGDSLAIVAPMKWSEAAKLPLCLLTPDMHNRSIVDAAFAAAGVSVTPAMETNSILTLALSVVAGSVCSVMPGALVGAVRGYRELEAAPLAKPEIRTPIGFITAESVRPSRTLQAALAFARDEGWLRHAAAHSGSLEG